MSFTEGVRSDSIVSESDNALRWWHNKGFIIPARALSPSASISLCVARLIIQSIKFTRAKKSEKRKPLFFGVEKKGAQSLRWVDDDEAAYDVEK